MMANLGHLRAELRRKDQAVANHLRNQPPKGSPSYTSWENTHERLIREAAAIRLQVEKAEAQQRN